MIKMHEQTNPEQIYVMKETTFINVWRKYDCKITYSFGIPLYIAIKDYCCFQHEY